MTQPERLPVTLSFTKLTDAPKSYTGQSGKAVKVKTTEDGLEFGTAGVSKFTELSDVPSSYTGQTGKTVKVKTTEDGLEFTNFPAGGQTLYDAVVAPSGGDYTTIGAAIAAGKRKLFIKPGIYNETADIADFGNITLIGSSFYECIINLGPYYLGISRAYIENVTLKGSKTTGYQVSLGTQSIIKHCMIMSDATSGSSYFFRVAGCDIEFNGCIFNQLYGSAISDEGNARDDIRIVNCDFIGYSTKNGAFPLINLGANGKANVIANNSFYGIYRTNANIITCGSITGAVIGNAFFSSVIGSGKEISANGIVVGNNLSQDEGISYGGNLVCADNSGASILKEFKAVRMKNTSGVALAAGNVVVLKSVAGGNEVTTTTTAGDNKVFGMAVESIPINAFGQIQILGKTTLLKVNGTDPIAIGDFLSTYTEAGIAKKAATGEMAFAIALENYAVADSLGVIDALLITPRKI